MYRKLFEHETRQLLADRTYPVIALTLMIVFGFGLWNGQRWVAYQSRVIAVAEDEQKTALDRAKAQAERVRAGVEEISDWASPASTAGFMDYHLVSFASRPPAPLAALAVGQSDLYPYLLRITTDHQSGLVSSYENVNVRKLLLGPFDLAFSIIYLLPLFILALCYDVLAGEKEQGILGLIAAQPIPLWKLVLVKLGSRLVLIVAVLVLLLASICALVDFRASPPEIVGQLLTWFAVVVAYSLFWFLLGVLVISRGWTSATNALVLAASWFLLVVLVPAGVSAWVAVAYPLPSRIEFIKALRDTQENAWNEPSQFTQQFFKDHPQLRPQSHDDEDTVAWPVLEQGIDHQLQAAEAGFAAQLRHQQDLAERLGFMSPALLVHTALLDLAETGIERQRDFLSQIDRYHTALADYFISKLARKEFDFTGYDEFPRFHYVQPASERLQTSFVALTILAGQAVLLCIVSLPALRRYPVGN